MLTTISPLLCAKESPATRPWLKRTLALTLWAGATCAWWLAAPVLLGVRLPFPILVLGLAMAVPLLLLRLGFGMAEFARDTGLLARPPHLNGPVFAVLLTAALLCPVLIVSGGLGVPVAASVALLLVSHLGALAIAALALVLLLLATAEPACPPLGGEHPAVERVRAPRPC